jgi:hypothetical protein
LISAWNSNVSTSSLMESEVKEEAPRPLNPSGRPPTRARPEAPSN